MSTFARVFFSGRMLAVFCLGFSSGLPLLLTGSTLKAWMKEASVDLTVIGIFALVGLPYTLKFLWSPLLDSYVPPFLGRRRGWILISQVLCAGALVALASADPATAPVTTAIFALIVSFFSATQDTCIDAYRRDLLPEAELGLGSSLAVNGYRIGLLVASAGALALADQVSWQWVYWAMAGIMLASTVFTVLSPEPKTNVTPPKGLRESVIEPVKDYFSRAGAFEILLFILLYKVGDSMASDMFNPFYLDIGFTKTQVAAVAKLFGFWSAIVGGIAGGALILKWGILRSLWVFGILQAISTFGFSLQAQAGANLTVLSAVIAFENLSSGMGTAAYAAFMAKLCNTRFTATQYALLASLMGVPRVILGSSSGYLAKNFGWSNYFLFCAIIAIPGLLMLLRAPKWETSERRA